MATVSTYLKMVDQFAGPLQRVSNGVQTAISAMERLKRVVEAPIAMSVDTSRAVDSINRTKSQLASAGGTSAIQVAIDGQAVTKELSNIRQRLRDGLSSATVQVGLDAQPALQAASTVRQQLASAFGTVEIATRLDVPDKVPTLQMQDLDVTVQLDQTSATAQWQSFRNRILMDGLPALTLEIDAEKAVLAIDRARDKIGNGKSAAIELALNVQDIVSKVADVKRRISTELSQAVVHVSLDTQQALTDATSLRMQVQDKVGQLEIAPKFGLPQTGDLAGRLSGMLHGVSPIVTARLAFEHDSAYQEIHKITTQLQNKQISLKATLDASEAMAEVDRIKQKIDSASSSAINIILDAQSVTKGLQDIRRQLQSELVETMLQITFDKQHVHAEAAVLQKQLSNALGQVSLTTTLDASGALAEVERLKERIESTSSSAIKVIIDAGSVTRGLEEIQKRLESDLVLQVALDKQNVLTEASALRNQINNALGQVALSATLDASGALAEVERLKKRISSGAFSAIHVILDANSVTQVFQQIQQRMRSGTEKMMVEVTFNARQAVTKAQMMKKLLEKELDHIRAKIQVELPASLTVMLTNLQRLVLKLIAAIRRMSGVTSSQGSVQQQIAQMQQQILQLQNQINAKTQQAGQASSGWLNNLKGIAATYLSFQGITAAMTISDDYINTRARLDLVNDGLQTTAELQDQIFQAAERARGSYQDMAGVIGRMGILASDAFSSNDELVAFSELMQKSFRVGGSSTMEQQAGMYQLSQAMAAGKLQGDEFRSIMENAPMLADAIAKFTGKSKGELKDMSAEGTITADIIKGAMFMMADELNEKLAQMPMTFGDVMNSLKNHALQEFGPVIERINEMLNSEQGQQFVANIEAAITSAAAAIDGLLTAAVNTYTFFQDNWSWIAPIIWGIVAAMTAYHVITKSVAVATRVAAVAMALYNAVMSANPIILVISLIIGLIAWFIHLWKTNDEFAAGLFRVWNSILNFFDGVPLFFVKIGVGIVKALADMQVSAAKVMDDLINSVIDGINWLRQKSNDILKTSFTMIDQVNLTAQAELEASIAKQAGDEVIAEMEAKNAAKAAEREQRVLDFEKERAAKRAEQEAQMEAEEESKGDGEPDYSKYLNDINSKLGSGGQDEVDKVKKVGQVDKIKDTVDISSEDLKMMRELADVKNIQNFVTLQPSIKFGDTHVRHESDLNTIIARITDTLNEGIASSADATYNNV